MAKLARLLRNFANRHFPEQAYRITPKAPEHLRLSEHNIDTLEHLGIQKVRVEYRRNVGVVVPRYYWTGGQGDTFLPFAIRNLPRDVLLITKTGERAYELRAGERYWGMSSSVFADVVDHLLQAGMQRIQYSTLQSREASQ